MADLKNVFNFFLHCVCGNCEKRRKGEERVGGSAGRRVGRNVSACRRVGVSALSRGARQVLLWKIRESAGRGEERVGGSAGRRFREVGVGFAMAKISGSLMKLSTIIRKYDDVF
jgi:hypothetical protein